MELNIADWRRFPTGRHCGSAVSWLTSCGSFPAAGAGRYAFVPHEAAILSLLTTSVASRLKPLVLKVRFRLPVSHYFTLNESK